jgi:uncharacterized membrane protein YhhN
MTGASSQSPFPVYFRTFTWGYACMGLLELVSNLLFDYLPLLHYLVKPMIMISLSVFYFYQMMHRRDWAHYLMQAALLFSLMGDLFLMFRGDWFFQLGLGSFLLAQIAYIGVFSQTQSDGEVGPILLRKPWLVLPFLAYGLALIAILYPNLGSLLLPVVIYALALTTMTLMALNRWRRVPQDSFSFVFLGALLFFISDSLIAVDRFAHDLLNIPLAKVWIMLTYMVAQYLIVMGILIQYGKKNSR